MAHRRRRPADFGPEHLLCSDCGHDEQQGTEGDRCARCSSTATVGCGPVAWFA